MKLEIIYIPPRNDTEKMGKSNDVGFNKLENPEFADIKIITMVIP